MKKAWEFVRELGAVDYSLQKAKMFVRIWTLLTFMQVALIAVTLLVPGDFRWWQVIVQSATMALDVVFLRVALLRLSRARARSERDEWVVRMYEAMSK